MPPGSPGAPPHPPGLQFPGQPGAPGAPRRPVGLIVTVSLLALTVLIVGAVATIGFLQLDAATATIRDQQREINDKQRELDDQREIIDSKETFGAAMESLLDEVDAYAGVPMATIIPWEEYEYLAQSSWFSRWNADELDRLTADVEHERELLVAKREAAQLEASSNSSGSPYEAVFDHLGAGYVTWGFRSSGEVCGGDAWACVRGEDPYVVHVVSSVDAEWYVSDWMRTGVAYHEMAHVLQVTNPEPTEEALASFDGNHEHMADCYALTFLDGWSLEHTFRSGGYIYTTSVGYGYTCNSSQRDVMRDWYSKLGVQPRTISS